MTKTSKDNRSKKSRSKDESWRSLGRQTSIHVKCSKKLPKDNIINMTSFVANQNRRTGEERSDGMNQDA